LVALIISHFIPEGVFGIILTSLLIWPWIAAKSLSDHVIKVAVALAASDLNAARSAVSMIVGRNAKTLDNFGIARASLESLAENTSDGVVAPLFWTVIFGLPGLFVYKAINTMDSMIGYRTQNYEAFGWAAAKLDDLANFLPARLTGLLFALTATKPIYSMSIMWRDAGKHRSPNAGWPESGFAAALNIQLSGPRDYEGTRSNDKWLHEEGRNPTEKDIVLGLKHYNRLLNWLIVVAFALLVLFWLNKAGY
jgi:adenosylcobinamide-phosphate synthase